MDRCRVLGHPDASWVCRVFSNGGRHLQYWCFTCQRAVTVEKYGGEGQSRTAEWIKREIPTVDVAALQEVRLNVRYTICSHCRQTTTCEAHHTAPQAIFADADEWPMVPLCPACHLLFTQTLEAYVQRRIQQAMAQSRRTA